MKQSIRVMANHTPVCCGKPMKQLGKPHKDILGKWLFYSCEICHKPKVELIEPSEDYLNLHRNDECQQ